MFRTHRLSITLCATLTLGLMAAACSDSGNISGPTSGQVDVGMSGGDDGGTTDAGTPTGGGVGGCATLIDCVSKACPAQNPLTSGCATDCFDKASADAKLLFDDVWGCATTKCLQGVCKDSDDPDCFDGCLFGTCLPEVLACVDDGSAGGGGCLAAIPCLDGCGVDTSGNFFECAAKCYAGMSDGAQSQYDALAQCLSDNNGFDDEEGLPEPCIDEYYGCLSDGKTGDQSCLQILGCTDTCSDDSPVCFAQCLQAGSADAQAAFSAMVPCFEGAADDPACEGALLTCIDPSGDLDCGGFFACNDMCQDKAGAEDGACFIECLADTSEDGAKEVLAFIECSESCDEQCADQGDSCAGLCFAAECPAIAASCFGGGG